MSGFEIGMLILFGASWPASIGKALRTKVVAGKSPYFLAMVATGYLCGITHKMLYHFDPVIYLYILNFCMVCTDLALYLYYLPRQANYIRT